LHLRETGDDLFMVNAFLGRMLTGQRAKIQTKKYGTNPKFVPGGQ
jgi:hypothetical protein